MTKKMKMAEVETILRGMSLDSAKLVEALNEEFIRTSSDRTDARGLIESMSRTANGIASRLKELLKVVGYSDSVEKQRRKVMSKSEYEGSNVLSALSKHPLTSVKDWESMFSDISAAMDTMYGRCGREGRVLTLATGGWSENEAVIQAIKDNSLFWTMAWVSSTRGGKYVFEMPVCLSAKGEKK